MLAAPLLAGHDLTLATSDSLATLTNDEVIAIGQDREGRQARRVRRKDGIETWVKPLAGDAWAVALLNRRTTAREVDVRLADVPRLPDAGSFTLRDLWAHTTRTQSSAESQRLQLGAREAGVWPLPRAA